MEDWKKEINSLVGNQYRTQLEVINFLAFFRARQDAIIEVVNELADRNGLLKVEERIKQFGKSDTPDGVKCPQCKQETTVSGEFPCRVCGRPTTHDEPQYSGEMILALTPDGRAYTIDPSLGFPQSIDYWRYAKGDLVKKSGDKGQFHGEIVGFYQTRKKDGSGYITERGYNVMSHLEWGTVQIYPEKYLEPWDGE